MKLTFSLATSMLLLLEVTAAQPAPAKPGPVNHMVYDAQLRQLILLSSSRQTELEEVRGWVNGSGWRLISAAGPATRELGGAAYDTRRKRLVLFGGMGTRNREDRRGDTWEWDGKSWHSMADKSVGTRDHHSLAYDEARGKTVMFGGNKAGESLETDTWEWDGARWNRVATEGPGGRAHFAMAYDSRRKQVVLFGGLGEGYKSHNDTWAWDGKTWQKLSADGPPQRTHHRMAFDSEAGVMVLFGGLRSGRPGNAMEDTWVWDGQLWKEIKTTGPAKRSGHMMAYDPSRRKVVLYGGGSYDGRVVTRHEDAWEFDGQQWLQIK